MKQTENIVLSTTDIITPTTLGEVVPDFIVLPADIEFFARLTPLEKKSILIAHKFLGDSFSLRGCMAYQKYISSIN